MDRAGKTVIPIKYDGLHTFSNGWARFMSNGKVGFLNREGKVMQVESQGSTFGF
ncbi:MAG: hypothetical protein COB67_08175 [SAR324 cluster bacterium]|uniref:WG repeat-containing protein n=1 Tax=SAR324 cluster bacterium TaxID=2024889 RepID=A0A2A4T256_9DELT|nr:MAG: hypothetical protein COB67_08175 [SAR324 cluster bacterium]